MSTAESRHKWNYYNKLFIIPLNKEIMEHILCKRTSRSSTHPLEKLLKYLLSSSSSDSPSTSRNDPGPLADKFNKSGIFEDKANIK
jgi:hypothetical protein